MTVLTDIWILPPLAFGRLGSATKACQAFSWASPIISPNGSMKTVLAAENSIDVDEDGVPTIREAREFNEVALKDEQDRFYPVCPFFELHGSWQDDEGEHEGPITPNVLDAAGIAIDDVQWSVNTANLKAFHYTLRDGDRVEANEQHVSAADTTRRPLRGISPQSDGIDALIPEGQFVPLGAMQPVKSTEELPGLRMRVYAPAGVIYAPTDIAERVEGEEDWEGFAVPEERAFLNPTARWALLRIPTDTPGPLENDQRVNPRGLAATFNSGQSLGLIDDASDGLVACAIGDLVAHARIAIGPPDFAPSARPFVSLQDGLADRVDRSSIRDEDISGEVLATVVGDIFERALETSDLSNKDAQNDRAHFTNATEPDSFRGPIPPTDGVPDDPERAPFGTLWARSDQEDTPLSRVDSLPVGARGKRKHRRLNALEYVKDRLKDDPDFVARWLRPPLDDHAYDRRMPALMRGSDRRPMHLTRRQYEMVQRWTEAFVSSADS